MDGWRKRGRENGGKGKREKQVGEKKEGRRDSESEKMREKERNKNRRAKERSRCRGPEGGPDPRRQVRASRSRYCAGVWGCNGSCRSWLGAKRPSQNSSVLGKTEVLAPNSLEAGLQVRAFGVNLLPGLWPCCFLSGVRI